MANRHVSEEGAPLVLVEHLADEPLVADRHDPAPARRGCDPRRLLATVLECEQAEVRDSGDVVSGGIDAKDTALVARTISMIIERRHCFPRSMPESSADPNLR